MRRETKETGIGLEGLQVFGHGLGFYFYKGEGACLSFSMGG